MDVMLHRLNLRLTILMTVGVASSCSLLFEQAAQVDGGAEIVDAASEADGGPPGSDAAQFVAFERKAAQDSEELGAGGLARIDELHLDINQTGPDAEVQDNCVALEFGGIDIPMGARIIDAFIVFVSDAQNGESVTVNVLLDGDVPAEPLMAATNDIRNRNFLETPVSWVVPAWNVNQSGPAQTSPSLAAQVQKNICSSAWHSGQSLVFVVQPGGDVGQRSAVSLEGSKMRNMGDFLAPTLRIRYESSDATNCL